MQLLEAVVQALEMVVLLVAAFLALQDAYFVRKHVPTEHGLMYPTVNKAMLWTVAVVVVIITRISPLHLLWMLPAGLVLAMLSLAFPFSLLSAFGRLYTSLCCLGVRRPEAGHERQRKGLGQGKLYAIRVEQSTLATLVPTLASRIEDADQARKIIDQAERYARGGRPVPGHPTGREFYLWEHQVGFLQRALAEHAGADHSEVAPQMMADLQDGLDRRRQGSDWLHTMGPEARDETLTQPGPKQWTPR